MVEKKEVSRQVTFLRIAPECESTKLLILFNFSNGLGLFLAPGAKKRILTFDPQAGLSVHVALTRMKLLEYEIFHLEAF